jgi:type IV secretory pathway VirB10-like protein
LKEIALFAYLAAIEILHNTSIREALKMEVEATPSIGQQNNPHPVSPSSPKKRPFDEIDRPDVNHGIEQTAASDPTPVPQNPSPAVPPITATATTTNKKVKLTPAEKQAKERQKAEEKARKDEERRINEEEKKKRDEEKEEKRRLKEEEKQAKEEEKKKKDRVRLLNPATCWLDRPH